MSSAFDVNKRVHHFTWWNMFFFAVLLLGLLMLLFPKKLFINAVLRDQHPSDVSINYLMNLIEKDPADLELKLSLAKQQILMGRLNEAKEIIAPFLKGMPSSDIEWQSLWIHYQILHIETYALEEKAPQRAQHEAALKKLLLLLSHSPVLDPSQQANLADEALALNIPDEANKLYSKAIARQVQRPAVFFARAAAAALFTKHYKDAAEYYLLAMRQSTRLDDKRLYYLKAVESLNAAGNPKPALQFAQGNIDGLKGDKRTLIFLTQLAIQAGQQKLAEEYVNQLMNLHYQDPEE